MRKDEFEHGQRVEVKVYDRARGATVWAGGTVIDPYSDPVVVDLDAGRQVRPEADRVRTARRP